MVRLCVLAENGGIWLDSTIILKENVDKWLFNKEADFSGFYLQSFTTIDKYPVIESWFLACNKESEFMKRWRDEFLMMMQYKNVKQYIDSRIKMGVNIQRINNPEYLAIHVSAQKVLQIDGYNINKLVLYKAEEGPYKYLSDSNWDSIVALFEANKFKMYTYPILKMRNPERSLLENKLKVVWKFFNYDSLFKLVLFQNTDTDNLFE